jgi:hypothetical protein
MEIINAQVKLNKTIPIAILSKISMIMILSFEKA